MTEIEIFGPHRSLIPEWTDPDTGEVVPEHWVALMFAEALGTDGQVHMVSVTTGIETTAFPEVREVREHMLRVSLEHDMKEKGVWAQ